MDISLVVHIKKKELTIDQYSTIDVNRSQGATNINITNTNKDLSLNGVFEQILKYLGDENTFSVTVKREVGELTFDTLAVDYHLNACGEVLHFGEPIKPFE